MIIFNISGGLGNQLFQYAFGRYLANKNKTDLYLRFDSFLDDPARRPMLDYFNTSYKPVPESVVLKYSSVYDGLHPFLKKVYRNEQFVSIKRYFNDKTEPWFKKNLKNARHGYFDGYWSHETYFNEIRHRLEKEFELKEELTIDTRFLTLQEEIQNTNSVAIHVRRGDYVSNQKFAGIFNQLPLTYYKGAIQFINKSVESPVFYIFSDDVSWVKKNFAGHVGVDIRFIADAGIQADYLEFSLMKSCKHFIIANSTFSWWAAWLAGFEHKQIVAPKDWYKDGRLQHIRGIASFIPDSWTQL